MKLVYIEWLDSYGPTNNWEVIEDALTPSLLVCRSVGWLVHDGADCKQIAPNLTQADHDDTELQASGYFTIPTVCILRMVELKVPKGKGSPSSSMKR